MSASITSVAVVGAGYMGGGIAQSMALAGFDVAIADVDVAAANRGLERLLAEAQEFEDQGLYPGGSAEKIRQKLQANRELVDVVADVDFIEEAVFETVDIKKDVLATISEHARPDAIIGTNTSTIPVHVLTPAVKHPERFLTVHFSNPAPFIPGVELVAGERTRPEVIEATKELLAKMGRASAQVADTPGMVLNRLQYVLLKEATAIVEDGIATTTDVDTIVRTTFGFRLPFFGPFAITDQAGIDVYESGFRNLEKAYGERLAVPEVIRDAMAEGRRGVKNGKGLTGDFDEETRAALVAYRNKAYSRMGDVLRELGPAPSGTVERPPA